jgi:hypothetical protein
MNEYNLQLLLSETYNQIKRNKEESILTGDRFNVFEILELSSNETRTHSAFLAALLNPRGLHGVNDSFLKLFINEIKFPEFESHTAKVEIEKNAGLISKGYEDGGRIDILISDAKGNAIIIENKIYAGDQYKQLYRYFKYGEKYYGSNFKLIYLNLYGNNPTDGSLKGDQNILDLEKHVTILSYKNNICSWLNKCAEIVNDKPIVKETLAQYIRLLKNLTRQSKQKNMEKNIIKLICENPENIEAALFLSRNSSMELKCFLIKSLIDQLNDLSKIKGIEFESDSNWGSINDETYIKFIIPDSKYNSSIQFGFDGVFSLFSIGVYSSELMNNHKEVFNDLKLSVSSILSYLGNDKNFNNWLYLHYYSNNNSETPYGGLMNWNDRTLIWTDIKTGKTAEYLFNIVLGIIEKLKGIEL